MIYFYHDGVMPLFILTAYAKNVRSDLSQKDRNAFKLLTAQLVKAFRGQGQ